MSQVEFSENSNEHIPESLQVLTRLFELQTSQETPTSQFMEKAFKSMDILADDGLRLKNPTMFALSAEKLIRLISGGAVQVPPFYHFRDYYNFYTMPEQDFMHGARAILGQKELLINFIKSDKNDSNTVQKQEYSILMNELFINTDHWISKSIKEVYSELQPEIIRHMINGKQGFGKAACLWLEEYPFTAKYFLEKAKKITAKIHINEFRPRIKEILTSSSNEVRGAGEELARVLLSKIGFTEDEITWEIDKFKPKPANLAESIDTIFALEQKAPRLARKLFHLQGIKHFGRYSKELLLDQAKYANDKIHPWGVIIYPYADHNDAYYQNSVVFDKLNSDLKNDPENIFRLRIVEEGNLISLAKKLLRLVRQYGPISFAVIGGHGRKDNIIIGGEEPMGEFHKNDISPGVERLIEQLCIPHMSVVLDSCLTGKINGFAQELSGTGLEVFAPKRYSSLQKLDLEFMGERPVIIPTYERETDRNKFKNGRLVKEG